jgi:23S rRNA pseudouridine1911/1915/1917 synthase
LELIETLRGFKRQALHAGTLGFDHPRTGRPLRLHAAVPADFAQLLRVLRQDARAAARDAVR